MRYFKRKSQLLMMVLVVGFLFGIIYENIVIKKTGITMDVFRSFFLEKYEAIEVVPEELLWYVVKIRISVLAVIIFIGCLRWRKVGIVLLCGWTGFLFGTLVVSSIIQIGITGVFLSVAGMFPHMLFYAPAYVLLVLYIYEYPRKKWNWSKSTFVILTVFIGIVLECYLNPAIMKMIIKIV